MAAPVTFSTQLYTQPNNMNGVENICFNIAGDKFDMTISNNSKMNEVFSTIAQIKGIQKENYKFVLNGELIGNNSTLNSIGFTSNDSIDIFQVQQGGGPGTRMPHNNRMSTSASMATR